jgi:osmotically-inducible protein OsmY
MCVTLALTMAVAAACGESGEPDPEEAPAGEIVMSVPDSTIEREIRSRLDADPRLDGEGIDLRVTSTGGTVMLAGEVPTRMEMSIAREVAMSAPGVVTVSFDSLVVLSERPNAAADTSEVQ